MRRLSDCFHDDAQQSGHSAWMHVRHPEWLSQVSPKSGRKSLCDMRVGPNVRPTFIRDGGERRGNDFRCRLYVLLPFVRTTSRHDLDL